MLRARLEVGCLTARAIGGGGEIRVMVWDGIDRSVKKLGFVLSKLIIFALTNDF